VSQTDQPAAMRLQTARLHLIPMSPSQLRRYLYDLSSLEAELGLEVSQAIMAAPLRRAIGMKLAGGERLATADWLWVTYWLIVIRQSRFGAGLIGFKGLPDAQGNVEIGYGIDPVARRQGYVTEAVTALIQWAFQFDACQVIQADTLKTNLGSRRVLQKVGMTVYEETADKLFWRLEKGSWNRNSGRKPNR
jgi:ribosomal-protein-alanine N-acetyltransferase